MTEAVPLRPTPPAVPSTADKFLALRKMKRSRTLVDHVEMVLPLMIEDEHFRGLITAAYNEQAVEGSIAADTQEAARLLRDKAKEQKNVALADEKLASIAQAMNRALHRYGLSRRDQRAAAELSGNEE